MGNKELFSFSKIDSFHNCPRNYYYTYILHQRGADNIYSFLGTTAHNLVEQLYKNEITKDKAVEEFLQAVDEADMLGLKWLSENTKIKYVGCITHFFNNFEPINNDSITIEEYFETDICGIIMRGYIDMYYIQNNTLHIIDFKTSSKFDKKTLQHKKVQLYLYAYALKEKFQNKDIKIGFDMLKYAINKRGTLKERNSFDLFDEFKEGYVWVEFNNQSIEELKEYIQTALNKIEDNKLIGNIDVWEMCDSKASTFFCKNLCSNRNKCLEYINQKL